MLKIQIYYLRPQAGFTLIELMVSIAIVAILASIAIPAYKEYSDKAKYTEVVQGVASYKVAVATCGLVLGTLDGCTGGQNGIPQPKGTGNINSIDITNGVITGIGKGTSPLDSSYVLSAILSEGGIGWQVGGSCREAGLC
ncbi:MAG: prepilin-type N-terminal cleavage/methylation domain-containing protein [Legionellales bacterium]|nr:prepilin-type N-terminal cleavage/methylation domain-containing protein [Legionellales bacterium]